MSQVSNVSNAFLEGLDIVSNFRFKSICHQFTQFFKHPAKRIEEYFKTYIVTDLEPQRIRWHVETRWSLQRLLLRILEQFSNIKEYFLKILVGQTSIKGKNDVGSRDKRPALTLKGMSHVNKDCDITMLAILRERGGATRARSGEG